MMSVKMELSVNQLFKTLRQFVNKIIDERLNNYFKAIPGIVVAVKDGGLRVDVQLLVDESILKDVENYNTRKIKEGDMCYIVAFGTTHRLTNSVVIFGGNEFR